MWARCMYHTVYFAVGLDQITSLHWVREDLRKLLLDHGRTWCFDPARRAFLAAMLAELAWTTHNSQRIAMSLMSHYHDIVADNMTQYVSFLKFTMPKEEINMYIFTELITEKLNIERRKRITLDTDIAMFTILNCLFAHWNSVTHDSLFEVELLDFWCFTIASVSPMPGLEVVEFLHMVDLTLMTQSIQRSHADIRLLSWSQQRKRKRETTNAIGACGICFDQNVPVKKTRCGHDFCANCLGKWAKPTCPTCRGVC